MSTILEVPEMRCPKCKSKGVYVGIYATLALREGGGWDILSGELNPDEIASCANCQHDDRGAAFVVDEK